MHTCSYKHLHIVVGQETHSKTLEVIFLSNYNLQRNVENLLLDRVMFRVQSLAVVAGLQDD